MAKIDVVRGCKFHLSMIMIDAYRGTSPIRKRPTPLDPPRTLGIGYGRVIGGRGFL